MAKVLVIMDGGIIQHVVADEPVEVYVVDYDVEGTEVDHPHLTQLDRDECLLFPFEPEINPHHVNLAIKTWETV